MCWLEFFLRIGAFAWWKCRNQSYIRRGTRRFHIFFSIFAFFCWILLLSHAFEDAGAIRGFEWSFVLGTLDYRYQQQQWGATSAWLQSISCFCCFFLLFFTHSHWDSLTYSVTRSLVALFPSLALYFGVPLPSISLQSFIYLYIFHSNVSNLSLVVFVWSLSRRKIGGWYLASLLNPEMYWANIRYITSYSVTQSTLHAIQWDAKNLL